MKDKDKLILQKILNYIDEIQDAINDYNAAILNNSKDSLLYEQRGFYKFQKKLYKNAAEDYETAIKFSPKNAHLYYMKGAAETLSGDKETAEKDFNTALNMGLKL